MGCNMSPRARTDLEKDLQRQKIITKANELVVSYGLRRVSVDDVVKAAGMAKGSFYKHFTSKEDLLMQLVWNIYQSFIDQAKTIIEGSTAADMRQNVGGFIRSILSDPDKVFFFDNHDELESLIAALDSEELQDFNAMEQQAFAGLITLAGKDVQSVKPGVVHNYIHAMYFAVSNDAVTPDYVHETIDVMLKGLLDYMFGSEG